jgi:Cu(I)/Ag(I) efflux system periplasmic protein CusF
MKIAKCAFAALVAALAIGAGAQTPAPHDHGTSSTKPAANVLYDGEVKRINKDASRVTLAHGPLKAFDMPAMTMAFTVKDPAQLARLKEGDKVRFALQKSGENLVVTRMEPIR